jgi:hypothetical protein
MMEMTMTVKLRVLSADDLRDSLSTSGVFDMTDCEVVIDCPLDSSTEEIRKMVNILESAIHITDIRIVGYVETDGLEYLVKITEVPTTAIAERRKRSKE